MIAIVDAAPLVAAADRTDRNYARCAEVLNRPDLDLVFPSLVVAEAAYMISERAGPRAEIAFIRTLRTVEVESPAPDEWSLIAELMERYADFPLGTTDASVAVLADRLETDLIITLDRRRFGAIRSPLSGMPYHLLPD